MSLKAISPNRKRSGQALILLTFCLMLMLAMMSFAVDLGWGYYRREVAQAAADSASAAAVRAVASGSTPVCTSGTPTVWCGSPAGTVTNCPATAPTTDSNTYDNACMLAAANGYTTSGSKTVSVQANTANPPSSAPTASYWVTVRVSETPTSFFGVPIGSGGQALSINVSSTSAIISSGVTISSNCMYLLGSSGTDFIIANGATLTMSGCGIYDNSSNTSSSSPAYAASISGGARVNTPTMQIVGTDTVNNGAHLCTATGTCTTLTPQTGVTAVTDPLSNLPTPANPGGCQSGNFSAYQGMPYTPSPGCYNAFTTGNGMAVNLSAGVYYINGGEVNINSGSVTGAGVMFYLYNGAYVSIGNGATVTLSAPTSGSYEGVLFYQQRNVSNPTASSFQGGANSNLTGTIYMHNSEIDFNNGTAQSSTFSVVANNVNFEGGSTTLIQAVSASQTGLTSSSTKNVVVQ